jgi:hypothetical protein
MDRHEIKELVRVVPGLKDMLSPALHFAERRTAPSACGTTKTVMTG